MHLTLKISKFTLKIRFYLEILPKLVGYFKDLTRWTCPIKNIYWIFGYMTNSYCIVFIPKFFSILFKSNIQTQTSLSMSRLQCKNKKKVYKNEIHQFHFSHLTHTIFIFISQDVLRIGLKMTQPMEEKIMAITQLHWRRKMSHQNIPCPFWNWKI